MRTRTRRRCRLRRPPEKDGFSALPRTCRPNRRKASPSTRGRTCSRSASCCTRWRRASGRSRATPASRSSRPSSKTRRSQSQSSIPRCHTISDASCVARLRKIPNVDTRLQRICEMSWRSSKRRSIPGNWQLRPARPSRPVDRLARACTRSSLAVGRCGCRGGPRDCGGVAVAAATGADAHCAIGDRVAGRCQPGSRDECLERPRSRPMGRPWC